MKMESQAALNAAAAVGKSCYFSLGGDLLLPEAG